MLVLNCCFAILLLGENWVRELFEKFLRVGTLRVFYKFLEKIMLTTSRSGVIKISGSNIGALP